MCETLKPCPFCKGHPCDCFDILQRDYGFSEEDWNTRPIENALCAKLREMDGLLGSLLNKVNTITAKHRHHQDISRQRLDALSNRQLDVEKARKEIMRDV